MLDRHAPLVRAMTFVGHSTGKSSSKGLSQREQTEVSHWVGSVHGSAYMHSTQKYKLKFSCGSFYYYGDLYQMKAVFGIVGTYRNDYSTAMLDYSVVYAFSYNTLYIATVLQFSACFFQQIVRRFREGGYNTLVATCVGEEGLDIGDVDLIVCFDAPKSPIRLVQRMGRTGRKRKGRIVMILAEGKEDQGYNKSQSNKKSIHRAICNSCKSLTFYQHCHRMVPKHLHPQVNT